MNSETLPVFPDTTIRGEPVLSEPIEVAPFLEGVIFIKIMDISADAELTVNVGISPYGYDDWEEHWARLDEPETYTSEGMYARPISNFGNFIRLCCQPSDTGEGVTLQAWFVGKG